MEIIFFETEDIITNSNTGGFIVHATYDPVQDKYYDENGVPLDG